jgi:hypothetical protein
MALGRQRVGECRVVGSSNSSEYHIFMDDASSRERNGRGSFLPVRVFSTQCLPAFHTLAHWPQGCRTSSLHTTPSVFASS